jgi:hypothetical protein
MADRHKDTVRSRIRGLARHGQNRSTGPYIGPTATHKGWLRDSSLEADPRAFFLENCSSKPDEAAFAQTNLKAPEQAARFRSLPLAQVASVAIGEQSRAGLDGDRSAKRSCHSRIPEHRGVSSVGLC